MKTKEQLAKLATQQREWNRKNPEACKRIRAGYYQRHRDKILQSQKEHRQNNPELYRVRGQKKWLKQYGLTPEGKQKMFDEQKGLCYLCRQPLPSCDESIVEHNHLTDEVRGLAHLVCNVRLGVIETLLYEDKSTLEKMLQVAGFAPEQG